VSVRVVVEFDNESDANEFQHDVSTRGEVTVSYDPWGEYVVKFIPAKIVDAREESKS
jgi:hypothetical protein